MEINVPHKSENATLVFGSTLNKHPCEASYAIDNVMIYLKWMCIKILFLCVLIYKYMESNIKKIVRVIINI